MSKKYDYIDWYCDTCDANLNRQTGFTTSSGSWTCTECGARNDVTLDNILDENDAIYHNECPKCGGHMRDAIYPSNLFVFEDCGAEAKLNDYGVLYLEE